MTLIFADERYLYGVAEGLADPLADGFGDADDIADVAVVIFYAHVDNAAVIGRTVKGGVYLYAPLAELLADVVGEDDVRSVHISVLPDNGVELMCGRRYGVYAIGLPKTALSA